VKVTLSGKGRAYTNFRSRLPLAATVVLDPPLGSERCADLAFPGAPGPACTENLLGGKITCK
jgi:hypothetical protein